MMAKLTGIDIEGLEQTQKIVRNWQQEARDAAGIAAAEYLKNVFQQQPPPRFVTRKDAYGVTFFSNKQRKWFFAALRSGEIKVPYRRTQEMRNSWQIIGSGEKTILVNETEAAYYTMDDEGQSRHEEKVGWEKVSTKIDKSMNRLTKIMTAAGEKALKKLGAR